MRIQLILFMDWHVFGTHPSHSFQRDIPPPKDDPLAVPEELQYKRTGSEIRQDMYVEHRVSEHYEMNDLDRSQSLPQAPADREIPQHCQDDNIISQDNYVKPNSKPPKRRKNSIGKENSKKGKGDLIPQPWQKYMNV